MKDRTIMILIVIGVLMIMLGIVHQIVETKCKTIDKNTDFWVRNCDYND